MTQTELIAKARAGKLVITQFSLHRLAGRWERERHNCSHQFGMRTVACDNEHDVVECPTCGDQRVVACNFDEDFA